MKRGSGRVVKPGRPHSEKAGEAALKSGERMTLYRALRELTCSRCGGPIREGETFTREAAREGGPPLVRRCRGCVPFTPHGLLDALFTNEGAREPSPPPPSTDVCEKVRSRLGPALAARRKDRGGSASDG